MPDLVTYTCLTSVKAVAPLTSVQDKEANPLLVRLMALDTAKLPKRLFAVVDATLVPGLKDMLDASDIPHASLFQGDTQDALEDLAPYLIELTDNASFLDRILEGPDGLISIWDRNAGFFFQSSAGLKDVVKHLRHLTMLRPEDPTEGRWVFFRFWTPVALHGLRHELVHNVTLHAALFGNIISDIIYQIPARDQWAVLSSAQPATATGTPPATKALSAASMRYVARQQVFQSMTLATRRVTDKDPSTGAKLARTPRSVLFGQVKRLHGLGIRHEQHVAQILAIIAGTGLDVTRDPAFHYVTQNAFLSPGAKTRQIVQSYVMVARTTR